MDYFNDNDEDRQYKLFEYDEIEGNVWILVYWLVAIGGTLGATYWYFG